MNNICIQNFHTPAGELILGSYNEALCLCDWRYRKSRDTIYRRIMKGLDASFEQEESDVIVTAKTQLQEYFAKDRKQFDIPLYMVGTKFQKAVWNELLKIPYGTTISYLKLSKRLENEKATRAVAAATGSNAHSIIIPCHRVIGNNGKIIGYAGGISAKKKLLMLESNNHQPSQLSLFDE